MLKFLPWFAGIVLIIRGLSGFADTSAVAGPLVALIMGALILPPVWSRLPLPAWTRWLAFTCGIVAGSAFVTPAKKAAAPVAQVVDDAAIPNPVRDLVIKKEEWEKGGFGSVGIHSFTVYNKSKAHDYKDISFTFRYMGESGSKIGETEKTVYKSFPAGKTVRVSDLNTGFIHEQAAKAAVYVTP